MQQAAPAMPPFGDLKARARFVKTVLAAQYPATFGDDPRPLKIGIHNDLKARHPEFSMREIRHALSWLIGNRRYLSALKPGAIRLDLDGQPADEVTEEQAEIARQRLAELKAARKAKNHAKPAKSPAPATPAPTPAPTPPPAPAMPPNANLERPVLRLKKPAGPVVSAAVVTRRAKL